MRKKIVSFSELIRHHGIKEVYSNKIACFPIGSDFAFLSAVRPIYADTYSMTIVLNGFAVFSINQKELHIRKGDLLLLYPSLLISSVSQSPDFSGMQLLCDRYLFEHLLASNPAYKFYPLFFYTKDEPVLHLSDERTKDMAQSLSHISRCILRPYTFQENILINLLHVCIMQVLEFMDERIHRQSFELNHKEELFLRFIELTMTHYKKEHQIEFYAQELSVSSTYLSRIVRLVTHRTARFFLTGVLYAEACRLLIYTDMTIYAIADELHFPDQSAFGKFFKQNAGMSPQLFRSQSE